MEISSKHCPSVTALRCQLSGAAARSPLKTVHWTVFRALRTQQAGEPFGWVTESSPSKLGECRDSDKRAVSQQARIHTGKHIAGGMRYGVLIRNQKM